MSFLSAFSLTFSVCSPRRLPLTSGPQQESNTGDGEGRRVRTWWAAQMAQERRTLSPLPAVMSANVHLTTLSTTTQSHPPPLAPAVPMATCFVFQSSLSGEDMSANHKITLLHRVDSHCFCVNTASTLAQHMALYIYINSYTKCNNECWVGMFLNTYISTLQEPWGKPRWLYLQNDYNFPSLVIPVNSCSGEHSGSYVCPHCGLLQWKKEQKNPFVQNGLKILLCNIWRSNYLKDYLWFNYGKSCNYDLFGANVSTQPS